MQVLLISSPDNLGLMLESCAWQHAGMLSRDSLGKIPTLVSVSSTRLLHHTDMQGHTFRG